MSEESGKIPVDPLSKEFIRVLTDFGFKRLFGTEEHAHILKRFLNALFEGEMEISSITFRPTELQPQNIEGKKIYYDIFCRSSDGREFIVEMQQEESENFSDRILFYVSRAVTNQGRRGVEYELDPVYCIVVTDFNMSGREKRLKKEYQFIERHSGEVYTDKVKIIFLALPEVPDEWDECETELERLLYLIKNMENLTRKSKPYVDGEYDDIFNVSATDQLTNEEAVAYSASYLKELDNKSAIRFAERRGIEKGIEKGRAEGIEKGRAEGIEKGRAEGIAKGRMETLREFVRNLRDNGFSDFQIAKLTNEDPKVISSL